MRTKTTIINVSCSSAQELADEIIRLTELYPGSRLFVESRTVEVGKNKFGYDFKLTVTQHTEYEEVK